MARWIRCNACGGRGKVPCWRCGEQEPEEQGECPECLDDRTEPCEECNTEGGYYAE